MCCCSSHSTGHSSAHAHMSRAAEPSPGPGPGGCGHCQCEQDQCRDQSQQRSGLQPPCNEGQSSEAAEVRPRSSSGCDKCSEMVRLETSHLWTGVSGVPGLGVSIPRSVSASRPISTLDEWDKHDKNSERKTSIQSLRTSNLPTQQVGSRSSNGSITAPGVKVDIPRVLSPRSSSCRSSGRSTGKRVVIGFKPSNTGGP